MSDPFAMALAALHNAAGSVAAEYTPPGGSAVALRVIHEQPSAVLGDGMPEVVMDTHRFSIRRVDVPTPEIDGTIVLDPAGAADGYRLTGDPLLDDEGVTWSCPAEPV